MASDGEWEVVADGKDATPEVYYRIERHVMRPCRVQVGEKELLFCLQPRTPLPKEKAARCASGLSGQCTTCKRRMPIFAQFVGAEGKYLCFCEEMDDPNVKELQSMRNKIKSTNCADHSVVVIDDAFYQAYPKQVGPFDHMHFTMDSVSCPELASRLQALKSYLGGSFENRFQKLVDDPKSLKVIQDTLPSLVRPDHWRGVVNWAVDFVGKACGKAWQDLPLYRKFEVMVYAMCTGRASDSIHLDMQQASNLIDFMETAESTTALAAMMDDRSNPETYQVSNVAERLRANRVASLCTVTLMWGLDGNPHQSDLDLHTMVNGVELYYGNRQVEKCCLDFDANAGSIEKCPAENISFNNVGVFPIKVNNFNNRDKKDVPFKVTVRKSGEEVAEYDAVWPKSRKAGELMEVGSITVTPEDLLEKPLELSPAEQQKLSAKEAEWSQLFGDPKSFLACEADVELRLVAEPKKALASGAQQQFEELLKPKAKAKSTLAQRCELETLDGFIEHVTSHSCRLEVNIRDFAPAYITRLETATEVLKNKLAVNVFQRKFELPVAVRTDEASSARLDESWNLAATAAVRGFLKVQSHWFMVLENGRLPSKEDWPLGGGMYPTNLKPEAHHHRSKWASFHSLVCPVPTEKALIGSMLVGFPSFRFILDGRTVTVKL